MLPIPLTWCFSTSRTAARSVPNSRKDNGTQLRSNRGLAAACMKASQPEIPIVLLSADDELP